MAFGLWPAPVSIVDAPNTLMMEITCTGGLPRSPQNHGVIVGEIDGASETGNDDGIQMHAPCQASLGRALGGGLTPPATRSVPIGRSNRPLHTM